MAEETEITDNDKITKKIQNTQTWLETIRKPCEGLKQDAIDFSLPRRGTITNKDEVKGQKKGQRIFDGSPVQLLGMWAAGTQGYHVSPAIKWFMQQYPEQELMENDDVRGWLQELDDYIYYVWRKSETLYSVMGDLLLDAGGPGDGYIYPEEDLDNDTIEGIVPNPKEVYVKRDKFGKIYISHRKYKLAAEDAKRQFKVKENTPGYINQGVSENLKRSIKNNPYKDWEFIHAVYRNPDYKRGKLNTENKKFVSYNYQVNGKKLVRTGGYDIMLPIDLSMVRGSGDDYGRGIVGNVIVMIECLNQLAKTGIHAKQLASRPPWNIPEEQRGKARLKPSGYNYYKEAGKIISAVQTGSHFPPSDMEREYISKILEQVFGVQFFLAMSQMEKVGQMNRWEIAERQSEKAALMGPDLEPFNRVLRRINSFILMTEGQSGRLPEPPPSVLDIIAEMGRPDVEFIGPLAQAQKRLFKTQGILNSLEASRPIMEMYSETALKLRPGKAIDAIWEGTGMPQTAITGDDDYEEAVAQFRQQQQMDKEIERAGAVAEALPKAGKAVEEDSPLSILAEQLMR